MKSFWNERYSEDGFAYGTTANDFLKDKFHRLPTGGKILCIAEGEGRNAVFLAEQGFKVTAVDFSEVAMKKARTFAEARKVDIETTVANLLDYDFGENKWDGIVSIFGHLPPEIRTEVHQKIIKALRPGGLFIMEAYTPEQLQLGTGGPKDVSMLITKDIISTELFSLKTELCHEERRVILEGKYHQGESAVIQFIGRKIVV